jgi:hypothetical protein
MTGVGEPTDEDVRLVLDGYAAWEAGDIERAVAAMHPEVEWIEPEEFPGGGRRQGPAEVAEYLRASREQWAELRSRRTVRRRGADIVVVHRVEGCLVDGSKREASAVDVYTVRDGQVVRMVAYADPAEVPET